LASHVLILPNLHADFYSVPLNMVGTHHVTLMQYLNTGYLMVRIPASENI